MVQDSKKRCDMKYVTMFPKHSKWNIEEHFSDMFKYKIIWKVICIKLSGDNKAKRFDILCNTNLPMV